MNKLYGAIHTTRVNSSRLDSLTEKKGSDKTIDDAIVQLASNGFDSSQIASVFDKVKGHQLQRPWGDGGGLKPSFENPFKPGAEWTPILGTKPAIDLKPIIDKPASPFGGLTDIIKPGLNVPTKPFPGFPTTGKPIIVQPEVELADPGLTDAHNEWNLNNPDKSKDIQYKDVDGELFVDSVGNDGVRVELTDIDQGHVADCYLLAVLGSIALHNPEYIENMITDNGNGTYTVSFGGKLGDVTVDDDLAVNQNDKVVYAQIGDRSNPELWVAIIEKAYVQGNLNTEGSSVRDGTYEGIGFGSSSIAMENITGQSSTRGGPTDFTPESMQAALANGQSVVMGTLGANDKKNQTPDGLWRSHVYVLTDVRQNSKGEWEVVIYNPHGSDEGTKDPFTVLTMDQFNTNFRSVVMTDDPVGKA